MRIAPEACASMAEVRAGVDSLDRELVALLAERFRFMNAAARIKPDRAMVRDEPRKRQVIENAIAEARAQGLNPALAGELWDWLVEASIAHELARWDERASDA
ncbi:chorismate mutase [Sandaracinobacter neustonicus]|uniref:chorismate mutase n=1 Tax=Sandaracinobacter neustonicus TaxID=1715348 RepID=A0A501XLE8_9SPHN|nr:chorismate mutase [Sandaracinobacter neustonicus]TPE61007.1 chorismate mutase [Sandaracinobacter neustonicus]